MTQSKLIELSYYDPAAQVRLSAYADTVVLDHNSKGGIISAVRFGGYPEMVRAMSDAIYGGATIEATQNSTTRMLQSNVKGYQRQMSHDGVYAVATLMLCCYGTNDLILRRYIQWLKSGVKRFSPNIRMLLL